MTGVRNARNNWVRHKTWLIPAIVALIAFIWGLVSNLIATDIDVIVKPYRPWVWAIFVVALISTIVVAIRDARHGQRQDEASATARTLNISIGRNVKGSTMVAGDKNIVAGDKNVVKPDV